MLQNIIQSIGLTDKQAKVYLACLKLGNCKVGEIAQLAKVNRVTCYTILEKLLIKGLIHESIDSGTKKYEAAPPSQIYQNLKDKQENFKKILPELKKIHRSTSHPVVRYFEGIDGIKSIYADTLTTTGEILSFANSSEIRKHWPAYDQEYVQARVNKKIFLRGITIDDETGQQVRNQDKRYYRKIKLINHNQAHFANEINIYDNKVAYTSFGDQPMGIIIEDEGYTETQRSLFQIIWQAH